MARRTVILCSTVLLLGVAQIHEAEAAFLTVAPFKADIWVDKNVSQPRGLVIDEAGDVLVVLRRQGIVALWEEADGRVNRTWIVHNDQSSQLTHGITIYGRHVYASSNNTVWRWRYSAGQRREAFPQQVVVRDVQGNLTRSNHKTLTLAAAFGTLYVSIGTPKDHISDSYRARVRSFDLKRIPPGGHDFANGVVFADGLRNEVGLAFDSRGRLWGVENGVDSLERDDLGGDIHNDNPAEEMNLFDGRPGTHYGFPYCWTEYDLPPGTGRGRGSQWAEASLANETITDSWCRNASNNRPPELSLQAHAAPLGITFFDGTNCGARYPSSGATGNQTLYAFSCEYAGDAFITFHGSSSRELPAQPVGYKVVRVRMNATTGLPVAAGGDAVHDVFGQANTELCNNTQRRQLKCLRLVDLKFTREGALLVTSDDTGEIFKITQNSSTVPAPPPSPVGSGSDANRVAAVVNGYFIVIIITVCASISFRCFI
ncbi:hypothetical protein Mapa_003394 [Marchantia paleacea]|nr:hypothetical protein Mapa_003394 [Marchantia paleacea]